MKAKHQPIVAAGRTMRIVHRKQEKKSMKNRIKNLKVGMRVAFQAGRESVLLAAHGLEYGEGYEVGGQNLVSGDGVGASGYSPVPELLPSSQVSA